MREELIKNHPAFKAMDKRKRKRYLRKLYNMGIYKFYSGE